MELSAEAVALHEAYLSAGVVSERFATDALHVAIAVTTGCPIIVSWNFRHIVHLQKIKLYNEISVAEGYGVVAIHSPPEVLHYDEPS